MFKDYILWKISFDVFIKRVYLYSVNPLFAAITAPHQAFMFPIKYTANPRAYFLPSFSQHNILLFSMSYLTSSFLGEIIQSGLSTFYRVQIRILRGSMLKVPDLVDFLPPLHVTASRAS